jgi:hypothetical protein
MVVAAGVVMLYARPSLARWARRWLTAIVVGYWILSCPAGAGLLARSLT